MQQNVRRFFGGLGVWLWIAALALPASGQSDLALERLMQLHKDGNYKEAYDGLQRFVLSGDAPSDQLPGALDAAITCLQQLNRVSEVDALCEKAVDAHPDDWRLLAAVARSYLRVDHYGYLIAGEYQRGPHRGGGQVVSSLDRDRVRALQLYRRAMQIASAADDKQEPSEMLKRFAEAIPFDAQSWRLQSLTDLESLPDYEKGWHYHATAPVGAPVNEHGNAIFYELPQSWDTAKSDGERWRWLLETMVEWDPARRHDERLIRARFLHSQFGVQTMAEYRILLTRPPDRASDDRPATWALDSLGEDETIARLATGIERFKLPDEHNFIQLYQQVAAEAPPNDSRALAALEHLGEIFQNRRQFPRAAEYWRAAAERSEGAARARFQHQLQQIVGNWGQFESVMTQPAGRGATVDFRYRNAKRVEFVAHEIRVRKLLHDVKSYLKSNPKQLDWQRMNISEIGYRLVMEKQAQYVGQEVAKWSLDLEPRAQHLDKRIPVTTPLQKPGAYLVTASVADGNTSKIVLWIADTAIVRKPMPEKSFYYVADAASGAPVAGATVEFFGFRQRHVEGNDYAVDTKSASAVTDKKGQVLLANSDDAKDPARREFQWIATATTPGGRLAYLGFHHVWRPAYLDAQYHEVKTFAITDRPVYRPGQTVEFKFWIRQTQYDLEDQSRFAHRSFAVEIHNPQGEKVYAKTLTSDIYGGIADRFDLPDDAALGQYQLVVVNRGGGTFRVEEYKKPEFEVTVEAPNEPVMLGENVRATIRAQYYFGAPVTHATVRYKVVRHGHAAHWHPPGPWDWLYGPGYWWFGYDYDWYPGWREWGCARPAPSWYPWPAPPPEIVAEHEAPIGPDGKIEVEFDTSIAKAAHPDSDHRYTIEAEVVDQSRRTVAGSGDVLVAREPFNVFVWVDRGYYRVGDTIAVQCLARRIDGKPVEGVGNLRLLKITYPSGPQGKPIETEVRSWKLPTGDEGNAEIELKASEKGRYRLSYRLTDQQGHEIEGGYVFTVTGEEFDGSEFRFSALELVPDKKQYEPQEKVQLQVNSNRVGARVLLFLRPASGAYLPPKMLRLAGKSTVVEIDVRPNDMPNFFVEAVTIFDGKVHTEVRQIHVPPARRVLNVEVIPSAKDFKPGQHATVQLKLTDEAGKPFVGSAVMSVFDKSVEYISGGTNVEEIKKFFWKWQRQHRPYMENNLDRWFANLVPPDQKSMESLGVFGDTVADEQMTERTMAARSRVLGGAGGRGAGASLFFGGERPPAEASPNFAADASASGAMPAAAPAKSAATPEPAVLPTVRSEVADTAFWAATLETDADGHAEVGFDMPENLTTWKIRVWAMGHGTRVGEATTEVLTRKDLIVRMQAPRYFVETDEVVLSANVHNYLADAKQVTVRLELDGPTLAPHSEAAHLAEQTVAVPAGGERRVDWRVKAPHEGEATVRMLALSDEESDAVEMKVPVFVHGMLKTDSYTGSLRPDEEVARFELTVPSRRRADATRLEIRYTPTLIGAMVDALPYLVEYPYGCTEQTLNRFLPAVITHQTLLTMKLDLKTIQEKRRTGAAALSADDAAGEEKSLAEKQPRRPPNKPNLVFDEAELRRIVAAGVDRLAEMQLADGGWGWFSGWGEHSTPHMTALVVHGLQVAQQNDLALPSGLLDRGVEWLRQHQQEQLRRLANMDAAGNVLDKNRPAKSHADNVDALVYMVLVDAGVASDAMRDHLYQDRTQLSVYGLAMYGLALHQQNEREKLGMVMRNIRQYVVEDDENQTAYLNLPADGWWYWYGSEFEAHAYLLKLLAATEPDSPLAPRLVKYLVNNRKHATYWNSTRDTALVIEALADYIKASGEDTPNMTVEVWVDGQKQQEATIAADNLFAADNVFVLQGEELPAGHHTIELRKRGSGPLYWNGYLTNFTVEDSIGPAGLELKVERRYYKLTPANKSVEVAGGRGQVVAQRVEKFERTPIPSLGSVTSGDMVEIELVVESKNDYEYILLEDMKAAGCEPVALRSGYGDNELGAYMELRDDRVALFVRRLARGRHRLTYRMRAETPGRFSALPARASAMYAPELRANSAELKLIIQDSQDRDSPSRATASIRREIP